ncbi:MAG: endonuclease/exonuclease/phosphatase family protein [Deltaproteobacteria bacterium]|nr:endonuclease/exonuclease/phosphatase family protein [Deltaproteobacteria bacterium]
MAAAHERLVRPPLVFIGDRWTPVVKPAGAPRQDVRLVTWNVWFGPHQFHARGVGLLAELERRQPDVIALQEVTPDLLERIAATPWIRAAYQLSDSDGLTIDGYGVVVMARVPVHKFRIVAVPSQMGRRLVVAELACGLTIASIHLESTAARTASRAQQLRLVQPYLAGLGPDVVLAGDMNFAPGDRTETAALDPSFIDAWPALHGDAPGYTIDSSVNHMRHDLRPVHRRIDRVFVRSAAWSPRAIALVGTAPLDDAGTFVSDHFGLDVTLALGDPRDPRVAAMMPGSWSRSSKAGASRCFCAP